MCPAAPRAPTLATRPQVRKLVVLPGADALISALGFPAHSPGGTYRTWHAAGGGGGADAAAAGPLAIDDGSGVGVASTGAPVAELPSAADIEAIRCNRDLLARRLEELTSSPCADTSS